MEILNWFTGGEYNYHPLTHCMDGDYAWSLFMVFVKGMVLIPYTFIAVIWFKQALKSKNSFAASALNNLMLIFFLCGLCGYFFSMLDFIWPAKRLEVLFHIPLIILCWSFIFKTRYIKTWYAEHNRQVTIQEKLQKEEFKNHELMRLMREQKESKSKSNEVLNLIKKTKKEISRGFYDDAI